MPASTRLRTFTLTGESVSLVPLGRAHVPALVTALAETEGSFILSTVPGPSTSEVAAYVDDALAALGEGTQIAFATIRRSDSAVVGSTRFCRIEHWKWVPGHPFQRPAGEPDVVEIGSTWLSPAAQRTAINTEAKYLMLTHAFEVWQVHRVALRTDARNAQSRRAIERIGAKEDGMIRADRPSPDGTVRDSVVYSILAAEWPDVKEHIESLLTRSR